MLITIRLIIKFQPCYLLSLLNLIYSVIKICEKKHLKNRTTNLDNFMM